MEAAEAEALVRDTLQALATLWADGYIAHLPGAPVRNREEMAQAIEAETLKYNKLVRRAGTSATLVTPWGSWAARRPPSARRRTRSAMRSCVGTPMWIKRDGRWQLSARDVSVACSR